MPSFLSIVIIAAGLALAPFTARPASHAGSVDRGFFVGTLPGADSPVFTAVATSGGGAVVGGLFRIIQDVRSPFLARLRADGSVDRSFTAAGGPDNEVDTVEILRDGKFLIGGSFTAVGGVSRRGIARLNLDGSVDPAFDPVAGPVAYWGLNARVLVEQQDGRILVGGSFSSIGGTLRHNLTRLEADGRVDATFIPPDLSQEPVTAMAVQPDGKILVGGGPKGITRLNHDRTADSLFQPGQGVRLGGVRDIALSGDGKTLLVGDFTLVDGVGRAHIARLHSDGSLDLSFITGGGFNRPVGRFVVMPDGAVVVGGGFEWLQGVSRFPLVRLRPNGDLDPTFQSLPGFAPRAWPFAVQGDGRIIVAGDDMTPGGLALEPYVRRLQTNGVVESSFMPRILPRPGAAGWSIDAAVIQPDRRILMAGDFQGQVMRLLPDGQQDTTFKPPAFELPSDYQWPFAQCLVLLPDRRILVGGYFRNVGGLYRPGLVRLNANGVLDAGFNAPLQQSPNRDVSVWDAQMQPDGRVIVAGYFTAVGGVPRAGFARLLPDGALDPTFDPPEVSPPAVAAFAIQSDGKILIGGGFSEVGHTKAEKLARLNPDGSLDPLFQIGVGPNGSVGQIACLADDRLLVAGEFTAIDGHASSFIARLYSAPPLPYLSASGIDPLTGYFHLNLHGPAGASATVLVSTNVEKGPWVDFSSYHLQTGSVLVVDTNATREPFRFFRAMVK